MLPHSLIWYSLTVKTKLCSPQLHISCTSVTTCTGPARPVRQVRFWPYHILVNLRLVGVGYTVGGSGTHVVALNWCECSARVQFETASCSLFVVLELPPTPHQLSGGFVFPWRAFGIDFFRSVMSRMTHKAEVSDSAVQSMTVLQEPILTTEK